MKRLSIAVLLVALFAAVSFAAVQDFGKFKIDVPAGWTATQDGETVGIVKDDNTAAISITYGNTDGASLEEIAEEFVKALKGRNLQNNEGVYVFEMTNANGIDSKCILTGENQEYGLVVITGGENAQEEVDAIMSSIKDD